MKNYVVLCLFLCACAVQPIEEEEDALIFDPPKGTVFAVEDGLEVNISTRHENAVIYYHKGNWEWEEYTDPVQLNACTVLHARLDALDADPKIFSAQYHAEYLHRFVFKPESIPFNEVKHVWVAGSFNQWNWTEHEMEYTETLPGHVLDLRLKGGYHTYKYKIEWKAPGSEPWFMADTYASRYTRDSGNGMNSELHVPMAESSLHTVEFAVDNSGISDAVLFAVLGNFAQMIDIVRFEGDGLKHVAFTTAVKHSGIAVAVFDAAYATPGVNKLYSLQYGVWPSQIPNLLADLQLPDISMHFETSSMVPAHSSLVSTYTIDFSWVLPGGTYTAIYWVLQQANNPAVWTFRELAPSAVSFQFNDTGYEFNGDCYWLLEFVGANGWLASTRMLGIHLQ